LNIPTKLPSLLTSGCATPIMLPFGESTFNATARYF